MPKKVTIEMNEAQARIVLQAVEEWFRLRMGQPADLAIDLALYNYKPHKDGKANTKAFDNAMVRRDAIEEILKSMFRIAFPGYGSPSEIKNEVNVASDIWSVLRYELSNKEDWMPTPFQIGGEPLPKITVMEAKEDATD